MHFRQVLMNIYTNFVDIYKKNYANILMKFIQQINLSCLDILTQPKNPCGGMIALLEICYGNNWHHTKLGYCK